MRYPWPTNLLVFNDLVSRAGLGILDCIENRQVTENAKSAISTKVPFAENGVRIEYTEAIVR